MVAAAQLPDSTATALAELGDRLGSITTTEPATLETYRFDWARDPEAGTPLAVVRPTTVAQVQETVRWAARHRIGVVPRGAGTSLSGGSTAQDQTITLSLERLREVRIDVPTHTAVVQPGAFNAEVKRAAAAEGLWYPPDPSSFEICSIGGNLATNAGGLCCVKYGVTTDYVLGLDVVLPDGTLVRLGGQTIKDVAGLSLLKLFVGSEGTLGVIVGATLRLLPAQPERSTLVATFATVRDCADVVVEVGRSFRPAMMELMDGASIRAVEAYRAMGLDTTAGAMLIAQSDAGGTARADEIAVLEKVCADHGAREVFVTDDADEGELFAAARRNAFPAFERLGSLLLEDVGVPVPALPELLAGIEAIAERHALPIPVVAHAGDGNTHPNVIYDAADADCTARAADAFAEIMTLAIGLGGTITGEHGVGRLKKAALPAQLGPEVMALTVKIKNAIDPDGIMNPGVLL